MQTTFSGKVIISLDLANGVDYTVEYDAHITYPSVTFDNIKITPNTEDVLLLLSK